MNRSTRLHVAVSLPDGIDVEDGTCTDDGMFRDATCDLQLRVAHVDLYHGEYFLIDFISYLREDDFDRQSPHSGFIDSSPILYSIFAQSRLRAHGMLAQAHDGLAAFCPPLR